MNERDLALLCYTALPVALDSSYCGSLSDEAGGARGMGRGTGLLVAHDVGENLFADHGVFDAGDNRYRAAAVLAGLDVDS